MKPILANSYRQMKDLLEQKRVYFLLVSDIEGLSSANDCEWGDLVILSDPVTLFPPLSLLAPTSFRAGIPLAQALRELDLGGEKAWAKPSLE